MLFQFRVGQLCTLLFNVVLYHYLFSSSVLEIADKSVARRLVSPTKEIWTVAFTNLQLEVDGKLVWVVNAESVASASVESGQSSAPL